MEDYGEASCEKPGFEARKNEHRSSRTPSNQSRKQFSSVQSPLKERGDEAGGGVCLFAQQTPRARFLFIPKSNPETHKKEMEDSKLLMPKWWKEEEIEWIRLVEGKARRKERRPEKLIDRRKMIQTEILEQKEKN